MLLQFLSIIMDSILRLKQKQKRWAIVYAKKLYALSIKTMSYAPINQSELRESCVLNYDDEEFVGDESR